MPAGAQYAKELMKHGYLAAWLPATLVRVGTIGVVTDNLFQAVSDLGSQGLSFDIAEGGHLEEFVHQSESSVQVEVKAQGSASDGFAFLGAADAGLAVRFGRSEGVLLHASGLQQRGIADLAALEHDVRLLHDAGDWDPKWVVVHEVYEADSLTVAVSGAKEATLELRARADIAPAANLAQVDLGLRVAGTKNLTTWLVGSRGLTPLFRGKVLKPRMWGARSPRWESALEPDEYGLAEEVAVDDEHVLEDFEY